MKIIHDYVVGDQIEIKGIREDILSKVGTIVGIYNDFFLIEAKTRSGAILHYSILNYDLVKSGLAKPAPGVFRQKEDFKAQFKW